MSAKPRFGTIGHINTFGSSSGLAAIALLATALRTKPSARIQLSAREIAEQDKRTERQRWNDEVAERKAQKKLAKTGAQS